MAYVILDKDNPLAAGDARNRSPAPCVPLDLFSTVHDWRLWPTLLLLAAAPLSDSGDQPVKRFQNIFASLVEKMVEYAKIVVGNL